MKVASSVADLESIIKAELEATLRDDVAPAVEQILNKHIQEDIYDAYDPVCYGRRGLLGSGEYTISVVNGLNLLVTNVTPGDTPIADGSTPTGTSLLEIIETGAQGNGSGKWRNAFARPAVARAQAEAAVEIPKIIQSKFL